MRGYFVALMAILLTAAIASGITYRVMSAHIEHVSVVSYNDGFTDGACRDGEDGFGNICR